MGPETACLENRKISPACRNGAVSAQVLKEFGKSFLFVFKEDRNQILFVLKPLAQFLRIAL